jgi:hypothetical protein
MPRGPGVTGPQADYSNRHFQYGGYSFGFVGAWPSNWLYAVNTLVRFRPKRPSIQRNSFQRYAEFS